MLIDKLHWHINIIPTSIFKKGIIINTIYNLLVSFSNVSCPLVMYYLISTEQCSQFQRGLLDSLKVLPGFIKVLTGFIKVLTGSITVVNGFRIE